MSSVQRYRLPLEAIVAAMKNAPGTVSIQATLPSIPNITKEACIAEIIIGQGTLHSCTITTRTGRLLSKQKEAYTILQQLGDIEWSVSSTTSRNDSPSQERPPLQQMSPPLSPGMLTLPMRSVASLSGVQMRTLAYTHKHVFALADGTKTVEHIARLLRKSPQEILLILQDLQAMNLIKW